MAVKGGGPFKKKTRVTEEIPTASMADIAFLLIIFFMVSTVFRTEEPRDVILPQAEAQEEIPERRKDILHLYVEEDGSVYINDRLVSYDQVDDVVAPVYFKQPRLVVSIRGDKDVPFDAVDKVAEGLKEAGAVRVNFATTLERKLGAR